MKRNIKQLILLLFIISVYSDIAAQGVKISENSGSPNSSAILDVESTTQGLLIPRMTSDQRKLISEPAPGLMVFDTDKNAFFIFGNGKWTDLSMSAEIWSQNSSYVYLTNSTNNVGIGTSSPESKLVIQADEGADLDDVLFEVLDQSGNPIFEVTSVGARIYVVDPDEAGAATTGGFAVGEYNTLKNKEITPCFFTNPEETRVYSSNATTGGFAVGEYNTLKNAGDTYMFMIPENYFIGHKSGELLQTGIYSGKFNTFFGYQAGLNDTSGYNNVFIGYESGYTNTSGNTNAFFGYQAGYNNTEGSENLFLGYQSGYNNTSGNLNSFMGYKSGYSNSGGLSNSFVGSYSGFSNISGSGNTFMGIETGYYNTTASYNVFVGYRCGYNNTLGGISEDEGHFNTFIGYESGLNNTTGANNTFIGYQAGSGNISGYNNIAIGPSAGLSNTSGSANTFIGYGSGMNSNNASNNVCVGNYSGENVSGTGSNVLLGNKAGRSIVDGLWNVCVGAVAGENSNSSGNILIGFASGYYAEGPHNIFIGSMAGYDNTEGEKNVFIGYQAGYQETGSERLYIDNSYTTTPLIYGRFDTDYVRIYGSMAVGQNPLTATNGSKFRVYADNYRWFSTGGYAGTFFNDGNATSRRGIEITTGTDDNSGTNYMIVFRDGDGGEVGNITSSGGWVSYGNKSAGGSKSDYKAFLKPANKLIENLHIVSFNPSDDTKNEIIGFNGEELIDILPWSTSYNEETNEYYTDNGSLVPILIKAVQEQQIYIGNLNEKLTQQESINNELKIELKILHEQISEIKQMIK